LKFVAKFSNDSLHYGLGYSTNPTYNTKLFAGAVYDSYKMIIYAQIYDDNGAFSVYNIPDTIIVQPDFASLSEIVVGLIKKNSSFETNKILNGGSYLPSLQEIQPISSLLNEQSLKDVLGLIKSLNNRNVFSTFPQIYGPLNNYNGVIPVIYSLNYYILPLPLLFKKCPMIIILEPQ
jgi:hypothetical protein